MGEHVERLVALSGVEHVKAYTKKDGTRVEAHTRTGGTFHVEHPDGTRSTRTSKTKNYTHAIVHKNSKGEYSALRFSTSEALANKGRGEMARYGFHGTKVVPVTRQSDEPNQKLGEAVSKLAEKVGEKAESKTSDHTSKASQKATQSSASKPDPYANQKKVTQASEESTAEVAKYSVGYNPSRHPKPDFAEHDSTLAGEVFSRRLEKLADGTYRWRYGLRDAKTGAITWHSAKELQSGS